MKSNFYKLRALVLTMMAIFLLTGLAFSQEKKELPQTDQHGPTVVLPVEPEGSSRAIGDDCTAPIIIGSLPYTDVNTTAGRLNNYDATCMGSYDGGEDIIYQFTLTQPAFVTATLNPGTSTWTGIAVMDACPMSGTCLLISTNSSASTHAAAGVLSAGTYYVMIDTYPDPVNIPSFTFQLTTGPIPPNFVSYGFLTSNETYSEITGGISLGTETSDGQYFTDPTIPAGSSVTGPGFDIGFPFVFNGTTFDRIGIKADGWIGLGLSSVTPSVNLNSGSTYVPLSGTSTAIPIELRSRITGFARDLQAQPGRKR